LGGGGGGATKSDSKAFGRLLCSRPKAKRVLFSLFLNVGNE
jgi:hypothetical protein